MNNKLKIGIAVVAGIIGIWLLSSIFFGGADEAPVDTPGSTETLGDVSGVSAGVSAEEGRAMLALLNDLKSIRLDETFFADTVFSSLTDWSVELAPEPKGRPNPFAPIGQDAAP